MGARGLRDRLSCLSSGARCPDKNIIYGPPGEICAELTISDPTFGLFCSLTVKGPVPGLSPLDPANPAIPAAAGLVLALFARFEL